VSRKAEVFLFVLFIHIFTVTVSDPGREKAIKSMLVAGRQNKIYINTEM
jgi:hypothetical protein